MARVVHVIGNGDSAGLYLEAPRKGLKLACNQTPFEIPDKYATCMVDFKMMDALTRKHKGDTTGIDIPGRWVLGYRPKVWMEQRPNFYMAKAAQIREFYTELPSYTWDKSKGENMGNGYTNLNCGHFAVHYACNRLRAEVIHMYGFDSIFDFNMNSFTDLVLKSDRGLMNNNRLSSNWRPVWEGMFNEFPNTQFNLHYYHDKIKFETGDNVNVRLYEHPKNRDNTKVDFDNISDA